MTDALFDGFSLRFEKLLGNEKKNSSYKISSLKETLGPSRSSKKRDYRRENENETKKHDFTKTIDHSLLLEF